MSTTHIALLGYLLWTILLSFGLLSARLHAQLSLGRRANSFLADGSDLSVLGQRATRAHGNSMEWIALPAGFLLYALATGQAHITDSLALVALGARVAQSTTHLISTSAAAVTVRGGFLGVQILIWIYWGVQLLKAGF